MRADAHSSISQLGIGQNHIAYEDSEQDLRILYLATSRNWRYLTELLM